MNNRSYCENAKQKVGGVRSGGPVGRNRSGGGGVKVYVNEELKLL